MYRVTKVPLSDKMYITIQSRISCINLILAIKYLRAGLTSKGHDKDALSSAFTT